MAYAVGTALPVGAAVNLATALFRGRPDQAGEADRRFTAAVAAWARGQGVDDILAADWEERLRAGVQAGIAAAPGGPAGRDAAVSLVAEAVFTPYTSTRLGTERAQQAASGLVDALPDMVLAAADPEFPVLRAVLGADLAQVLDRIDDLAAQVVGPAVDGALVETYRAALARALASDPWLRLLGRPDQDLDAVFAPRRVVHCPGGTRPTGFEASEAVELDVAAEACDRLVVRGGPGSGKTWAAMHLVRRACAAEGPEVPLFVRAAAILDRDAGVPPWDAALRSAVEPLAEVIGRDEAEALRRWLDQHATRVLVVVDGLDEAVNQNDTRDLDRLARPGREVRVVVTSRPGAWKNQLALDPAQDRLAREGEHGGHAVVDLEPLTPADVTALIAAGVPEPAARQRLADALLRDRRLADMALTPLLCVMLCALAARGEGLPAGRTELVSLIVTQLVRSSWRSDRPVPDDALDAAHRALGGIALEAAVDDPDTDLGAWPADIAPAVPSDLGLDAVLPPAGTADGWARRQTRRFVHRLVWSELLAAHLAEAHGAASAAALLRHHVWFDEDWDEVVPAVLALHPDRSAVLRALLDAGPDDLAAAAARLDGFGEIHRLLVALAARTAAADWPDPECRALIVAAAHEQLGDEDLPLRLALRRGGWPDSVTRGAHLRALAIGRSYFAPDDCAAGIATLALSDAERRSLATGLAAYLTGADPVMLTSGAPVLDILCGDDLGEVRQGAIDSALRRLDEAPATRLASAVVALRGSPAERHRAGAALLAQMAPGRGEWRPPLRDMTLDDAEWATTLAATTDDPDLHERAAGLLIGHLTEDHSGVTLRTVARALGRLQPSPESRAEALARLLKLSTRFDAYETSVVGAGMRSLLPGLDAKAQAAVLAGLLRRSPGQWDGVNLEIVTGLVAEVARADPGRARGVAEQLAADLELANLGDLNRLLDILEGLRPDDDGRERAARTLLARLPEVPATAILSCAEPLRRLDPPAEVRAEAARTLVAIRAAETDPRQHPGIARGILWFAPPGPDRLAAVKDVAGHIAGAAHFLIYDLPGWAPSATTEEKAVLARALLDHLGPGDRPMAWVAADALVHVTDGPDREEAWGVLLARLRASPETHRSDWLPPLAALGAPPELLEEANDLVVAALDRSDLDDALCYSLRRMWDDVPLTPAQAEAARAVLAARLADPRHFHPRGVAELLGTLDPPPSMRAQVAGHLRARLPAAGRYERSDLVAALRTVEPGFVDPDAPDPAAVALAELRERFSLHAAREVADADPDEATRREALAALVEWAGERSGTWPEIEIVARGLGLTPSDLAPLVGTEAARAEPVRALARAARRACRGEEWRAFLVAQA